VIRAKRDPEMLAEWEEAKARDEAEGRSTHKMLLWDRIHTGAYHIEKRRRELRQKASERRARALSLRPDKDDGELGARRIGDAVAVARRKGRLTQAKLAEAVGFTRSSLAHIESGRKRLTFDEACRLADALAIPLEQLRPT